LKHHVTGWVLVCGLILSVATAGSVDLSTEVYPSLDELEFALAHGEIDLDQYQILRELLLKGVDSTSRHLLDEVPNLADFGGAGGQPHSRLGYDQRRPYLESDQPPRRGATRFRMSRELDRSSGSQQDLIAQYRLSDSWRGRFTLSRDTHGGEYLKGRSLEYRSRRGWLRRLTLGDYTHRFGLGVAKGYRGRVVAFEDRSLLRSLVFPNNGRANGIQLKLHGAGLRSGVGASLLRDSLVTITRFSIDGETRSLVNGVTLGAALVQSSVRLRNGTTAANDSKVSVFSRTRIARFDLALESVVQLQERSGISATVGELSMRDERLLIQLAAWSYHNRFLDLSSGAKSANLRRRVWLEDSVWSFRSRRTGQTGCLVRTRFQAGTDTHILSSAEVGHINRDSSSLQVLLGLEHQLSDGWSMRVDWHRRDRHIAGSDQLYDVTYSRARLEARYETIGSSSRGYLAHRVASDGTITWSAFFSTAFDCSPDLKLEVWINAYEISEELTDLQRAYSFVHMEQRLGRAMSLSLKLRHQYAPGSDNHHNLAATISTEARF